MAAHNLSPSLVLANPTDSERSRIWQATHSTWGAALTEEEYLQREEYLLDSPLSRNGGLQNWILTQEDLDPDNRPILSSFESYKKRALIAGEDGVVKEVTSYGVASVFTFDEHRGNGYASRMMKLFADRLRAQQREDDRDAAFSVLWSDVGKQFYSKIGWKVFPSAYLEFPITQASVEPDGDLELISFDHLANLAARDEELLHKKLPEPSSHTRATVIPDLETLKWHLFREDFMCKHIFSRTPSIRGAIYTPPNSPESRVWAIWTRAFYGGRAKPEKNTLYFLRLVVEDENIPDEELTKALKAIVSVAQKEAPEWLCAKAEIWNPGERVQHVALSIKELGAELKDRESNNLASLQWFGPGSVDQVEWVASEKYAWC